MTADTQHADFYRPKAPGMTGRPRKKDDSAHYHLDFECRAHRLPPHVWKESSGGEFKLVKRVQKPRKDGKQKHVPDRWRFDFAWPDYGLIVEIDGGVWIGGAHAHPIDITRNMAKRNDAAFAGFAVLAYTPQQVKRGEAIADVERWLAAKGWTR